MIPYHAYSLWAHPVWRSVASLVSSDCSLLTTGSYSVLGIDSVPFSLSKFTKRHEASAISVAQVTSVRHKQPGKLLQYKTEL